MKDFKEDFPIFQQPYVPAGKLIYCDNAATSQKPQQVINALSRYYEQSCAPVHRGLYALAENATRLYEHARETIAVFLGVQDSSQIVFTKSATESINFIAFGWAMHHLRPEDEIVLTELEHHSNLVVWQVVAARTQAVIKFIPIDDHGILQLDNLASIITDRTKLVSFTHRSNAIGTKIDPEPLVARARAVGAKLLIDCCQTVAHERIDAEKLGVDFLVFSGHKMLGPEGIGVLFIKSSVQPEVVPYQFGGGMIFDASFAKATWLKAPHCYEAGTQPVGQAIALAQAVEYLMQQISFAELAAHEAALCRRLIDGLSVDPSFRFLGPVEQIKKEGHLVSFVHESYHAHDIAAYLDQFGICVRAGNFCAQPLAQRLGIESAVRVSFYLYNTIQEVDFLVERLLAMRL
jgi:cysteine desulfurase/selenocysteine lyase